MTTTTDYAALRERAAEAVRDAERNWNEAAGRHEADAAWHLLQAALARLQAVIAAAKAAQRGQSA